VPAHFSESKPRPPDAFCIFHFTPADELSRRESELVQAKEAKCNLLELCIFGFKSAALCVRLRVSDSIFNEIFH
jgi:hypothetical protein